MGFYWSYVKGVWCSLGLQGKVDPYAAYDKVDFDIPIGKNGDCYDRYLIRMEEMKQSLSIINQVLDKMPSGPIITDNPRIAPQKGKDMKESMESLISHLSFTRKD